VDVAAAVTMALVFMCVADVPAEAAGQATRTNVPNTKAKSKIERVMFIETHFLSAALS